MRASGYSSGQVSSFQAWGWPGRYIGTGTNLFQALGYVPPGVATAPSRQFRRNSVRETCQPPRLPAAAERQVWVARAVPASATMSARAAIVSTATPDSAAANSKV